MLRREEDERDRQELLQAQALGQRLDLEEGIAADAADTAAAAAPVAATAIRVPQRRW